MRLDERYGQGSHCMQNRNNPVKEQRNKGAEALNEGPCSHSIPAYHFLYKPCLIHSYYFYLADEGSIFL